MDEDRKGPEDHEEMGPGLLRKKVEKAMEQQLKKESLKA